MITGVHAIIFSAEAEKVRGFLADTIGLACVAAGRAWSVFVCRPPNSPFTPPEAATTISPTW